jgi:PBSX family phage terminase large subunit
MTAALSDKQERAYLESTARQNLFHGSVRSGKTFSSILRFAKDLRHGPPGDFLISGVTRETIQRNLGADFKRITGFEFPPVHSNYFKIWGRAVHILGASDLQAERKIQGSTLAGAYVDEAALLPHSFYKMLLSRLSVTGAKLIATMNPQGPYHWMKEQYIDRQDELDMNVFHFVLNDNPSLSEHYKTNLSKEYTGLWFKRYIEGLWVLAEGVVYDCFDDDTSVILAPPRPAQYHVIGVDVGTTNPTCFVAMGYHPEGSPPLWCEKEFYYNSKKEGKTKAYSELAEDFVEFIEGLNVRGIYIDPSAAAFIAELRKLGVQNIYPADNDVLNGIQTQYTYLRDGTYKICANCIETRREYTAYIWDEKRSDKGEDKPVKEHDHTKDAERYPIYTFFSKILGSPTSSKEELDKRYNNAMGRTTKQLPKFFQDNSFPMH